MHIKCYQWSNFLILIHKIEVSSKIHRHINVSTRKKKTTLRKSYYMFLFDSSAYSEFSCDLSGILTFFSDFLFPLQYFEFISLFFSTNIYCKKYAGVWKYLIRGHKTVSIYFQCIFLIIDLPSTNVRLEARAHERKDYSWGNRLLVVGSWYGRGGERTSQRDGTTKKRFLCCISSGIDLGEKIAQYNFVLR